MKPPLFWSQPPNQEGLWPFVLAPLSWLWKFFAARRWRNGKHLRMPIPVVCVGNINLGGTGKTPTVIEVVNRISDLGKTAHIVSRGYGGALTGPVQVDPRKHTADQVGDEPLLLAAFAPCWIATDRGAGAQAAVKAGADVIVLDDGLQNPALVKDLSILVVDAYVGFGNGRVVPAGPLRQEISEGMDRADIVLAIGRGDAQQEFQKRWADKITPDIVSGELLALQTGMEWAGLRALAFAGIGRPEKFFETLSDQGVEIVAQHSFSDHQKLSNVLLARLEKEANALGAQMVTTEKDAARLPADFQQKVLTLPVRLVLEDPEKLCDVLGNLFRDPV